MDEEHEKRLWELDSEGEKNSLPVGRKAAKCVCVDELKMCPEESCRELVACSKNHSDVMIQGTETYCFEVCKRYWNFDIVDLVEKELRNFLDGLPSHCPLERFLNE